jgi:hypothetical protein
MLLVGDASFDPHNYLGTSQADIMPTGYIGTSYLETASDTSLADTDGDGIENVGLGRFSARNLAEVQAMVQKTLNYQPDATGKAILVNDRNDDQYQFSNYAARVGNLLPGVASQQIGAQNATARTDLLTALQQNPRLLHYAGHGAIQVWGGQPLLQASDAPTLANRPTLFVSMTCYNGYFHDVAAGSLSEALMRSPHAGAVAVWSSSALTNALAQSQLSEGFYPALRQGSRLGDAARSGKAHTSNTDVRQSWLLLGDPTLKIF